MLQKDNTAKPGGRKHYALFDLFFLAAVLFILILTIIILKF
jgi:hypothetical protein